MVSAVVTSIEPVGGSGHQYGKMLMVVVYAGGSAIHRRGYRHANKVDVFLVGGAALARNCHSELPENSAPGSAANFLPLRGLFVLRF